MLKTLPFPRLAPKKTNLALGALRRLRKGWLVGCLLSSLYPSMAWASTMALPVDGTNLKPGEREAIGQLVVSAYQTERRDRVFWASQTQTAPEQTESPSEAAKRLGASEYLHLSAVRLKERIVLTATLHDRDGRVMHSAKMTASSLDDVENAAERLA